MVEYIPIVIHFIEVLAQAMLGLTVAASALAKLINKGKYSDDVESFSGKLQKFISYLPTLGINPKTKHLESQLKEMKEARAKDESRP